MLYTLKLLQIGDIISLALCHGWRSVEITEVPYDFKGTDTKLLIQSKDGLNYTVTPYPFDEQTIRFSINGKDVDRKIFTNDQDLRDAIKASPDVTLDFTINKG